MRRRDWNKSEVGKAWAKEYYKKYMPDRQRKLKEYLEQVRTQGKCVDCGESDSRVLQFHHRDGKEKYVINMYTRWGLTKLKEEIAKCDLLCANCHIKRHHNEQSGYFAQQRKEQ